MLRARGWSVGLDRYPGDSGLRFDQLEHRAPAGVGEQPSALADDHRKDEQVDLTYQVVAEKPSEQVAGARAHATRLLILRADFDRRRAALPALVRGPDAVSELAMAGGRLPDAELIPVLIDGVAGVVVTVGGRPFSLMGFIVRGDRIVEIDAIGDPERVARLAAPVLG